MSSPRQLQPLAVAALAVGTALLVWGCGSESTYTDVEVTTPEVAEQGPTLTMAQWKRRVGEVCREAAREASEASAKLASEIQDDPAVRDEGEISRRAFELSKPVFEEQLRHLAALRPPAEVADDYQAFLATLADELRWTGRIAYMIDDEDADEQLTTADRNLAEAATDATAFVESRSLAGCLVPRGSTAG